MVREGNIRMRYGGKMQEEAKLVRNKVYLKRL